ncbi:MAG: lysostaphin resistance A-like protein [Fimbriiglobus sp.]
MPPIGPDPLHSAPVERISRPKRRRVRKPSVARVTSELVVVLAALFAVVIFVPLSSRLFSWVCGAVCVLAGGYAIHGVVWRSGVAAWWGFTWGGRPDRHEDDLASGLWNTGLLAVVSLVPIAALKCLAVPTPSVLHPVAYLLWCVVQDFLFFSLILPGFERLTDGKLPGHRHFAVFATAVLFGLSHSPMMGFMVVTALIGVCWGYLFLRTRLLWPITACHFVLGLLVMA